MLDQLTPRGLKGVVVADTAIGDVRGEEGFYHYRQFDATSLAERYSLEDVWSLIVDGALPAAGDRTFANEVALLRELPSSSHAAVDAIAATPGTPAGKLRAAWTVVAEADGMVPSYDQTPVERRATALRLVAMLPTVAARLWRVGQQRSPLIPDPTLSHTADFLRMLTGHHPTDQQTRLLETYLISTIDHGFNNSTFATRVVVSSGADIAAALGAGLASLSGPLHGGAPSRVLELLDAVGDPSNARDWALDELSAGRKIMGFGHAVYRHDDPRARLLRSVAESTGDELARRAIQVEAGIRRALAHARPELGLPTNVEFYAAVVLHLAGIPADLCTTVFGLSRSIGWSGHALEQANDNKIIRPSARYIGPAPQR